jgi:hypothetical protein
MTSAKRSWPLLLVAAGAFLPGVGLVFAAAALTWGLISDRPKALWAAGFAAFGGLLNLAAAAVLLWRLQGNAEFTAGLRRAVQADLVTVVRALEDYRARWQEYPARLSLLNQGALALGAVNLNDLSMGFPALPGEYRYTRSPDGRSYDLFGIGPDRTPGTADDVRPALPDTLARRSGYRPAPAAGD